MKKAIYRLIGLAILAAAGWGGYRFLKQLPERQQQMPTTKVQRGDVVIRAFSRGELRAVRSVSLTAPNLFGTVQVTELAPMGSLAREKDLIVEYDDSERRAALEEAQLSVEGVDENIKKLKADQAIQKSQDAVTLLRTRYNVRRAQLEVQRNPIISVIDGKKNQLTLEQQKRALLQLESDIEERQVQLDSQMAVYLQNRDRSQLNVQRELQRIAQTRTLSPITGLVAIRQNRAGSFNFGQQLPDIREGDTLQPGMQVADVLDLSELEVWAKIGELDRANLQEGQEALLQLDAIPDKRFRGKIKAMSGTASADVFSGDPAKKFDVVFSIDMRQLLAGLGMKPADIDRIMATAAANAKKNVVNTAPSFFAGLQGGMAGAPDPGGDSPDQAMGRQDSQDQSSGGRGRRGGGGGERGAAQGGDQGRGQGRGGGFGNMSDEDRQKMRQLGQQLQTATPEERQKIMQQMQEMTQRSGGGGRGQGRGQGTDEARVSGAGPGRGADEARVSGAGQDRGTGGGQDRGGDRQGRGGGGGFAGGVGDPLQMMVRRASASQFTEEERNNAKLPLPPDQDSQVQVLLRPGLLADVEIVVENIPDALHVPAQAVFTKNGKPTVFVQNKDRKFEPREVQLLKRSESTMVLASGVQPGEIIALSDPTANKSGKAGKGEKKSQGSPAGSMPGGK